MDIRIPSECRKFREDHGFKSRQAFADELGVHYKTVQGWEKEDKPTQIDLDNLLVICEKFHCDLDYLIGRITQQTHAIKTACEVTGLSEDAIKKLSAAKRDGYADTISHLIESEGIIKLIHSYHSFFGLLDKLQYIDTDYKSAGVSIPDLRMRKNGQIVMNTDEAIHHYITRTSMILTEICEDDFNRKVKEEGILWRSLDDYKYLSEEIEATKEELENLERLRRELEGEANT